MSQNSRFAHPGGLSEPPPMSPIKTLQTQAVGSVAIRCWEFGWGRAGRRNFSRLLPPNTPWPVAASPPKSFPSGYVVDLVSRISLTTSKDNSKSGYVVLESSNLRVLSVFLQDPTHSAVKWAILKFKCRLDNFHKPCFNSLMRHRSPETVRKRKEHKTWPRKEFFNKCALNLASSIYL